MAAFLVLASRREVLGKCPFPIHWVVESLVPRKGLRAVFPPLLVDCDEAQFLVYAVGASNCRAT